MIYKQPQVDLSLSQGGSMWLIGNSVVNKKFGTPSSEYILLLENDLVENWALKLTIVYKIYMICTYGIH